MQETFGYYVTYQYDSLNRLLSATSSQSWSETYGFDGFGNLLSKTSTGGAPTLSQSVDPATNRIMGQSYDNNGNQMSSLLGLAYDAENRIAGLNASAVRILHQTDHPFSSETDQRSPLTPITSAPITPPRNLFLLSYPQFTPPTRIGANPALYPGLS